MKENENKLLDFIDNLKNKSLNYQMNVEDDKEGVVFFDGRIKALQEIEDYIKNGYSTED